MKKIALLTLTLLLFSACQAPPATTRMDEILDDKMIEKAVEEGDMTKHEEGIVGEQDKSCKEGELIDGKCELTLDGEKNTDLFSTVDALDVIGENVTYLAGYNGYLAQPKVEGTYPAVIMIHEWWGLNDNIRTMAKILANEGYVVLAVDLYGETTDDAEQAKNLSSAVRENKPRAIDNMRAAITYLKKLPAVKADKIASLGWCFGGEQSLQLALASDDLAATVIYYGSLATDKETLQKISAPVMGIFGADDAVVSVADVETFNQALTELDKEKEIYMYRGVGHAFANPSGSSYAPKETLDAWKKTLEFFKKHLSTEDLGA